jgi:uncharacterized protein YjlB
MNRRRFSSIFAALGLLPLRSLIAQTAGQTRGTEQPEVLQLSRNGWMPNNDRLPVLLYRAALPLSKSGDADPASTLETAFERNGWPPQWRNGVYDFHHYHSTAHEVLGFASGHARIMLGGENGHEINVYAGDIAVLPAGTGHRKIEASHDFLVVGAYPPRQSWDICRAAPSPETLKHMRELNFPKSDPVTGSGGFLLKAWHSA